MTENITSIGAYESSILFCSKLFHVFDDNELLEKPHEICSQCNLHWVNDTQFMWFSCPVNSEFYRYRIAQNFDGQKFWRFWHFPARPSKFNLLKTIQHSQVYGERQWPTVKIFSVKYLKSRYPSNFLLSKFCAIRLRYMFYCHQIHELSMMQFLMGACIGVKGT